MNNILDVVVSFNPYSLLKLYGCILLSFEILLSDTGINRVKQVTNALEKRTQCKCLLLFTNTNSRNVRDDNIKK
jgi:hypothetical protein